MLGWAGALCLAGLAFFLRRWHLGTPHAFSFDETYYAKDAWSLLNFGYVRGYVEDADKTILNGEAMQDWNTNDMIFDVPTLIVHGKDGMDEASLGAATLVGELKDGQVREYEIHPEDFGMAMTSNRSIRVSSKEESAVMIMEALNNQEGTARDIVGLNAGLAIYAANHADSIEQGLHMAFEAIANGAAREKLEQFRAYTRKLNP